ncbi:MAG: hypothetical protein H6850_02155 [Alphaproteobacteria bacterium]|nr:MAG: hypothetical protein H6850_02155 [Alphaproteobacteria bacterium]
MKHVFLIGEIHYIEEGAFLNEKLHTLNLSMCGSNPDVDEKAFGDLKETDAKQIIFRDESRRKFKKGCWLNERPKLFQ